MLCQNFAAIAFEFQGRLDPAKPYECGVRQSMCLINRIKELHANESPILSSEEFDRLKPNQIAKLGHLLHGFEVDVVFFLCSEANMVGSVFSEMKKED